MLSLFTEHLILLDDDKVTWACGKHLQSSYCAWHEHETGEPLAACAALMDRVPRAFIHYLDRITLVLGFPHVQYLMVPWQENLYNPADWHGYAGSIFSRQTGLDPDQWEIEIDHAPFGSERLAAAISKSLLEDLRALFKARQFLVYNCLPLLTFALQRYWQELSEDCVFAVPQINALNCLYVHKAMPAQICALHVQAEALLGDSLIAVDILSADQGVETLVVAPDDSFLQQPSTRAWRWLGPVHPWLGAHS